MQLKTDNQKTGDPALNLKEGIKDAFSAFGRILSAIADDQINSIPFEGSWTAGQVADHIMKSIGNLPRFFSENTGPCERQKDEKVKEIRKLFLDFSIKMKTPDFIRPLPGIQYKKAQLLENLQKLQDQTLTAAETYDLSYSCKSFEFPQWGYLTRWEWLEFVVCHIRRHTHQLKNIKQALSN